MSATGMCVGEPKNFRWRCLKKKKKIKYKVKYFSLECCHSQRYRGEGRLCQCSVEGVSCSQSSPSAALSSHLHVLPGQHPTMLCCLCIIEIRSAALQKKKGCGGEKKKMDRDVRRTPAGLSVCNRDHFKVPLKKWISCGCSIAQVHI